MNNNIKRPRNQQRCGREQQQQQEQQPATRAATNMEEYLHQSESIIYTNPIAKQYGSDSKTHSKQYL